MNPQANDPMTPTTTATPAERAPGNANATPGRTTTNTATPPRGRYPRGPSEPRDNGQHRDYSRERQQRSYYDRKRDEEAAAPEQRERSRERQSQDRCGPPRTEDRERRDPRRDGTSRLSQPPGGRDPAPGQFRGGGRTYPARNQTRSENFAKDIQPNVPASTGGTKQEKNARFANATINNMALEREEEQDRGSQHETLSDATAYPSDGDYHTSDEDGPAGNDD